MFQRRLARDVRLRIHFVFRGDEACEATVAIAGGKLVVTDGLDGDADLRVRADSAWWLAFLRKDRGILGALLTRKLALRGNPRHLLTFARCFLG